MIHEGANFGLEQLRFREELDGDYALARGIRTLHFRHSLSPSLPAVAWGLPADLAAAKVGQLHLGDFAHFPIGVNSDGSPVMPTEVDSNSTI